MGIDYTLVGERLRKARLEKKLTQENLAEELDVSVAFLSRLERGSSHINLKRLHQLCELLDTSEGYILSGASQDSKEYLKQDFKTLLDKCTPAKQKLIYNVVKAIVETEDEK